MAARRGRKPPTPPPEPEEVEEEVPPPPPPEIYGRLVFLMPYRSLDLVARIQAVQEEINCQALNLETVSRSALASRSLTQEELENPELDILTGFVIIDKQTRLYVIEGMATGGIANFSQQIIREQANSEQIKMLSNADVKFNTRLYLEFGGDLKRIKLREPLAQILMDPDIYIRAKVSEELQDVLHKCMELRRANRLKHVKEFNLCPSAAQLNLLERKYGDALSNEDLYGSPERRTKGKGSLVETTVDDGRSVRFAGTQHSTTHYSVHTKKTGSQITGSQLRSKVSSKEPTVIQVASNRTKLKADLDSYNPEFEEALKQRQNQERKNYLQEYMVTVKEKSDMNTVTRPRDMVRVDPGDGEVYIYSGQKLNYTEHLKRQMAAQLENDKHNFYALSPEYLTLSWPVVDEEELEKTNSRKYVNTRLKH